MPMPAPRNQERANRWHNSLPEWIVLSPTYPQFVQDYPAAARVLQAVADACDRPDRDGSLVGAIRSGRALAAAAPCSVSSVWRSLRRLISAGFVVPLSIGGTVWVSGRPVNAASVYGIPGSEGVLDHRRVRREERQVFMEDGARVVTVLHAGDQATLWPLGRTNREKPPAVTPCPTVGQGAPHGGTLPYPYHPRPIPLKAMAMALRARGGGGNARTSNTRGC